VHALVDSEIIGRGVIPSLTQSDFDTRSSVTAGFQVAVQAV
jgi:hypothetical protein